ncbi:MAG: hypothetical protein ACRCX2_15610 [Paraclostridium sp.]
MNGHKIALRIKHLINKKEEVEIKYKNLKLKTTKNLHVGLQMKREIIVLETEAAKQRSLYYEYLAGLRMATEFKNK